MTVPTGGMADLESRLDRIELLLSRLAEEHAAERRRREARADLARDLGPVAEQVFGVLEVELEAVRREVTGEQVAELLRTLARSLPTLESALAQLVSLSELGQELAGMSGQVMEAATSRLATLEERGYSAFGRAGMGVVDRVVTAFGEEDVEALGDNIVLILETVKEMTQPEVMQMLRRTVHTVQGDGEGPPPSLLSLLREVRDPGVRRGLSRVLHMLRSVGDEPAHGQETQREDRDIPAEIQETRR